MNAVVPPLRQVGAYRLVDLLGRGGMGEVYRAVHGGTGRVVAVKIISPDAPLEVVRRFANEARLQATMHHPNIATLEDYFEWEGRPYLVMEYVDGETLADRLAARGRLEPLEALRLFRDILGACSYVHQKEIIHRDLKPTNIRITSTGVVKLLDFGIARSEQTAGLTRVGSVIGTPRYLSPEQLQHGESSARSDVWALGVLLYEMVTGQLPFDADTFTDLWAKVTSGTYRRLAEMPLGDQTRDRDLVKRLDRLIGRCLKVDPEERLASAAVVLDEVDDVLGGQGERMTTLKASVSAVAGPLASSAAAHWRTLTAAAVLVLALVAWLALAGPDRDGPVVNPVRTTNHRIDVVEGRATVFVNGQLKGQTPLTYVAGPHETIRLELRQPGYEPVQQSFDVTTKPTWTLRMRRAGEPK
ncbi:MAG: serine/threonine-protein kinase [Vicinamibacterales bacterium]